MKKFILTSCLSFITMSMFAFTPLRFGAQIKILKHKKQKTELQPYQLHIYFNYEPNNYF